MKEKKNKKSILKALWTNPWLAMNPPVKNYRICQYPEFRQVFFSMAINHKFEQAFKENCRRRKEAYEHYQKRLGIILKFSVILGDHWPDRLVLEYIKKQKYLSIVSPTT